jgi:4-hydroxy-L-threonine phosphate dehydrogenase PdxA
MLFNSGLFSAPRYLRIPSIPNFGPWFEVHGMRIFFLSRHVSLRKACDMSTKEHIKDYVKHSLDVLKKLGIKDGTMAIAGLNPHCGEHGILGTEEQTEVIPAVQELQAEGYPVAEPSKLVLFSTRLYRDAITVYYHCTVNRYICL